MIVRFLTQRRLFVGNVAVEGAQEPPNAGQLATASKLQLGDGYTPTDLPQARDNILERLRANIMTKLNLEMGNTPEILDVALRILPEEVCLVPENRAEITTEGGLDAAGVEGHRRRGAPKSLDRPPGRP